MLACNWLETTPSWLVASILVPFEIFFPHFIGENWESKMHERNTSSFIIDREAGEIIRLVASVCLSVRPPVSKTVESLYRFVCNLLLFRHVGR